MGQSRFGGLLGQLAQLAGRSGRSERADDSDPITVPIQQKLGAQGQIEPSEHAQELRRMLDIVQAEQQCEQSGVPNQSDFAVADGDLEPDGSPRSDSTTVPGSTPDEEMVWRNIADQLIEFERDADGTETRQTALPRLPTG